MGSTIQKTGKLWSNGWTDWESILHMGKNKQSGPRGSKLNIANSCRMFIYSERSESLI